jgi:ABC-type glycerol-3-phosphate transport system substrate-binding protein
MLALKGVCLLLLFSLLGGCSLNPLTRTTLVLYVETGEGGYGLKRSDNLAGNRETIANLISAYKEIYPDTDISPHFPEGDEILSDVKQRTARGLGPDLMLTRLATAEDLSIAGLTEHVSSSSLDITEINPSLYSGYQEDGTIYAVPVLLLPQVACFDATRIASSPDSINGLISMAAGGIPIGLPIGIRDNYWTTTGMGAQEAIFNLFSTENGGSGKSTAKPQKQSLIEWLSWLKTINLQKNISFFRDTQDLDRLFREGDLAWIPCRGASLREHLKAMGDGLGVAPLPGNAGVPARPINVVYVFTFGPHSSQAQSQAASKFVSFMLSRFVQRQMMLGNSALMPVNGDVLVPVKSSTALRALDQSVQDGWTLTPGSPGIPQNLDREITDTIQSVILGTTSEREAAAQFLDLRGKK